MRPIHTRQVKDHIGLAKAPSATLLLGEIRRSYSCSSTPFADRRSAWTRFLADESVRQPVTRHVRHGCHPFQLRLDVVRASSSISAISSTSSRRVLCEW